MRKEFCEKDGKILHSNFDDKKISSIIEYLKQIYPAITTYRTLDSVETA